MAEPPAMGPGPGIDWELGVSTQLQRVLIIRAGKGDFKRCPTQAGILGWSATRLCSAKYVKYGSYGRRSHPEDMCPLVSSA